MSFWDAENQRIVGFPTEPWPEYPGWERVDCGCCNGLRWGGESPVECDNCKGNGTYARHIVTGTCAQWPGGPLLGAHDRRIRNNE